MNINIAIDQPHSTAVYHDVFANYIQFRSWPNWCKSCANKFPLRVKRLWLFVRSARIHHAGELRWLKHIQVHSHLRSTWPVDQPDIRREKSEFIGNLWCPHRIVGAPNIIQFFVWFVVRFVLQGLKELRKGTLLNWLWWEGSPHRRSK